MRPCPRDFRTPVGRAARPASAPHGVGPLRKDGHERLRSSPSRWQARQAVGGALTDEALDSSRSVLGATRFGNSAGCSSSTRRRRSRRSSSRRSTRLGRLPVLDPTAGNGALLAPWPREQRFGVEIDGDQVQGGRLSRDHWRRAACVSDAAQAGRAGPADRRQPALRPDVDRRRRAPGEQHGRGVAHEPRAAGPPGRRCVHLRARPLPPRGPLARGRGGRVRHRGVQRPVRGRGPALPDRVLRRPGGPQRRRRPGGRGRGFQGRARRAGAQPRDQDRVAPGGPLLPRHVVLPARWPGRTVAARRARA